MSSRGRRYVGAIGSAVLNGLLTTVWVALEELPAGARRLARLGVSVAIATVAGVSTRDATQEETAEPPQPQPSPAKPPVTPARVVAMAVLIPAVTVGPVILRRRLERRWLDRLTRAGHPHPHRVVALRIGAGSLLLTLASNLIKAHRTGTPPPRPGV